MTTEASDLYRRAIDLFDDRVRRVGPADWARPTPCTEWDVRALVNHVTSEDLWAVHLLAGGTLAAAGDRFDGDVLGDAPAETWAAAAEDARRAASSPGVASRTVELSSGRTPAPAYLMEMFADHLIHAWDLSVAIDVDRRLDPALVDVCQAWFADYAERWREAGAIGPAVAVGDDAGPQDRLLASFGRNPRHGPDTPANTL